MRREEKQQIFSFGLGMGMKDGAVGVLVEAPHNFLNFLYWIIGFSPPPPCSCAKPQLSSENFNFQTLLLHSTPVLRLCVNVGKC